MAESEPRGRRYQYLPLDMTTRSIRLVLLSPAKSNDHPLSCEMIHTPLDDARPFGALSYEWRGEKPEKPLSCVDGSILSITPNCYAALTRIRDKKRAIYLWVDAICINQANTEERNDQVSMMFDIYSKSTCTLVWLGEASSDSDDALKFLRRACFFYRNKRMKSLLPRQHIESWNMLGTVFALAHRSYWTRIWTLQEFAASNPIIYCGDAREVSGLDALEVILELERVATDVAGVSSSVKIMMHWGLCRAFAKVIGAVFQLSRRIDLLSRLACTEERDKLFALKAIYYDSLAGLTIDYNKPVWDVFSEATRLMVSNENSLHILLRVARPASELRRPSWAVDWNYIQDSLEGDYTPSKNSLPKYRFSLDGRIMYLRGTLAGEISSDISFLFPSLDTFSGRVSIHGSEMSDYQRNLICFETLIAFYRNSNNSAYPDLDSFLESLGMFLDPENGSHIFSQHVLTLLGKGDVDAVMAEFEEQDWMPFMRLLNDTTLFMTADGRFGVSRRDGILAGDKIVLISGLKQPAILRPWGIGYLFISPAVVSGLMEGQMWPDDENTLEEFDII